MTARSERAYLLALVYVQDTPRTRGAELAPAIEPLVERLGVSRMRCTVTRDDDASSDADAAAEAEAEAHGTTVDATDIAATLADPRVLAAAWLDARPGQRDARVTLSARARFAPGVIAADQAPRSLHAILALGDGGLDGELARAAADGWLETCARQLDVLHGGITVLPSYEEAIVEATLVGLSVSPAVEARWRYDAHRRRGLWSHARRLYWTTLLGPELATRAVAAGARDAGAAEVREIEGSLLVRATRDPGGVDAGFAARATALRRWLWPHTVQNPVDADLAPATVVLATAGRLVIESPELGRRVLSVSLPELAKGDAVHVAFPGVGDRVVLQLPAARGRTRTLAFDPAGQLVDDYA